MKGFRSPPWPACRYTLTSACDKVITQEICQRFETDKSHSVIPSRSMILSRISYVFCHKAKPYSTYLQTSSVRA
jgi:hypothetical protein